MLAATYLGTWLALWLNHRARKTARNVRTSLLSSITPGATAEADNRDKRAKVTERIISQISAASTFVSVLALHDAFRSYLAKKNSFDDGTTPGSTPWPTPQIAPG
jgi:hypothetical protein